MIESNKAETDNIEQINQAQSLVQSEHFETYT